MFHAKSEKWKITPTSVSQVRDSLVALTGASHFQEQRKVKPKFRCSKPTNLNFITKKACIEYCRIKYKFHLNLNNSYFLNLSSRR